MSGQKIIDGLQEVIDGKVGRMTTVHVTPPSDLVRAIRAGCTAADFHTRCSYPECKCKQMPKAIEAAIKSYTP